MSEATDPRFPVPDSGHDHPLDEVIATANDIIEKGGMVLQKFTCGGCGNRLTMTKPNKFYTTGTCDKCGFLTDIAKDGCNFVAVMPQSDEGRESLRQILADVGDGDLPL